MAHYSYSRRDYSRGDDLVRKIYRELPRHSQYPTQYIVNDGTLVIDDKSLRNTNSVIYNSHGSTMWVQPSAGSPHWHDSSMTTWNLKLHTCRGCSRRRELSGGYCGDCIDAKLVRPRVVEVVREDRRLLGTPERRLIEYR